MLVNYYIIFRANLINAIFVLFGWTERYIEGEERDRAKDRQTDRKTDRQTEKEAERQTDRPTA